MHSLFYFSNTVGYQDRNVNYAYTLGAIVFDGVATSGMSIQDIKPHAPKDQALEDYAFTIQILDAGGGMTKQFGYLLDEADGGWGDAKDGTGWYDLADEDYGVSKSDYVFKPGEGFMFESTYGDESGAGYTLSGAVATGVTKIPVNYAYSLIGNIRPCELSIQDMIPYAPKDETLEDYTFTIQILDAGGGMTKQFGYLLGEADGGWGDAKDGTGWYDLADEDYGASKSDYVFKAGEGFMFESTYGDISEYDEGKSAGLSFKAIVE